ncbi:hypothetical protein SAY87_013673 [Trapa incisa]|uniref:Uncharacterized protein n=1 Tax=Trapa incisa TaxID=236973 RepID=A0AAN7KBJ0_9MYRT|nr:hypothetical protein SAY87_013673 [Trapa incisa]
MVAEWRRRAWRWRGEETVRDHMSGEGDSRKVQGEMERRGDGGRGRRSGAAPHKRSAMDGLERRQQMWNQG